MKLAILGHSPIALEAAVRFHEHGAAVTLFDAREMDEPEFLSVNMSPDDYISETGRRILQQDHSQRDYQACLKAFLKEAQDVKPHKVKSVTKRFLGPLEIIPGKSRFYDLFRIIYEVSPRDFILGQKESSPEKFERLNQEMVDSLQDTLEMYEDFDLVLDMRTDYAASSAAYSGRALGENRVSHKVKYGKAALDFAKSENISDQRELALIGSNALSAEILLSLKDWLRDERSRLFLVTTEEEPFSEFFSKANDKTKQELQGVLASIDQRFEEEIADFTQKLKSWQQLDDFVQVKIQKPVEPIPQLNFFSGHNVTAMDELIDRKRLFLTLEKPEFRQGLKHPENNKIDLKTLGVDHILVSYTKKDNSILQLNPEETGFFELTPARPTLKDAWKSDLSKLKGVEDEIFKLFSAAHNS